MSDARLDLTGIRRRLHSLAELSGREQATAAAVGEILASCCPDAVHTRLGGHGLAAAWGDADSGPTVLLRADLDALPILDDPALPHASRTANVGHKCGHDGHMAMLLGVAEGLCRNPPGRGRAVLLFQPAEETGEGARAVLDDPAFVPLRPDVALALHNLPGLPLGVVVLRDGVTASASQGLSVTLRGASSHAAEPEAGRSPALALAQLVQQWSATPQLQREFAESAQVTVVHARLGEEAFGTSPGLARVMATLRAHEDAVMKRLVSRCEAAARALAAAHGLDVELEWVEPFPVTRSAPDVNLMVGAAAEVLGLPVLRRETPFPWSEDFGHFTAAFRGALFGLGAGETQPALHHPDYDFPDDLLTPGAALLDSCLRRLLAADRAGGGVVA